MSNRIAGLAYGGDSLADRYAGTGAFRRPLPLEGEAEAKAARWKAKVAFERRVMAGEVKRAVWRSGFIIREVEVMKVTQNGIRIGFDGCKLMVFVQELHEWSDTALLAP